MCGMIFYRKNHVGRVRYNVQSLSITIPILSSLLSCCIILANIWEFIYPPIAWFKLKTRATQIGWKSSTRSRVRRTIELYRFRGTTKSCRIFTLSKLISFLFSSGVKIAKITLMVSLFWKNLNFHQQCFYFP